MGVNTTTSRPLQTKSLSFKMADKDESKRWREQNVDYYADSNGTHIIDDLKYDDLFRLAEGYLNTNRYNYITNPVISDDGKRSYKYPATLRNYDMITPVLELLKGEKIKRRIKPMVYAVNSDMSTIKEQQEKMIIQQQLDQDIINQFNEAGIETGFDSRDLATHEEILTQVDEIKDDKAIIGQQSLNYILQDNEMYKHLDKSWHDYLSVSFCGSYKDIIKNNIIYHSIDPAHIFYIASQHVDYIEDGEAACIKMYMTPSEVVDYYYEDLSEDEIKNIISYFDLEHNGNGGKTAAISQDSTDPTSILYNDFTSSGQIDKRFPEIGSHTVEVSYVNWKSLVQLGKVTSTDIFGNKIQYEVEEGFKPRPDERVEWKWVNQLWEGVRIDYGEGLDCIYIRIRPVPHQRASFDNPSKCKLLINGFNKFSRRFTAKSIVGKLSPYQEIVNALYWQVERVINKNKDKLVVIPYDLVPSQKDMGLEDMFYYALADGFLFLEGKLDNSKMQQLNAIKPIDLSLSNYISYLKELIIHTRAEAEELLGISRQRKGQVNSSDGKGTTEQAIFQSSIMTESLFNEFEEYEKREYQGLLDLSKYAWINGKKATYVNSDKKTAFLNVQGPEHMESEYGIFAGSTSEEKEKKDMIKARTLEFVQNGMRPSVVTKLINSDNLEEMMDIIEIDEQRFLKQQQEAAAVEQQAVQAAQAFEEQKHYDEMSFKYAELSKKHEEELLKLENILHQAASNSDSESQAAKFNEMAQKTMIEREKIQVEREKIAAQERMNKENNKTALRNKVVGESKKS